MPGPAIRLGAKPPGGAVASRFNQFINSFAFYVRKALRCALQFLIGPDASVRTQAFEEPGSSAQSVQAMCLDRVPPRTDSLQAPIVAIHHLQRCSHRLRGRISSQVYRRWISAEIAEQSVVSPEAGEA